MKHAGPATLLQLQALLAALRRRSALVERQPGTFYRKSHAFLHFHEDPSGIFADVKLDGLHFTRMRATTADERSALLAHIDQALQPPAP